MDKNLQKRLVGTAVVIALAVIFVPMMLDGGKGPAESEAISMQIEIPPKPTYDIPNRLNPAVESASAEVVSKPAVVAETPVATSREKVAATEPVAKAPEKVAKVTKPVAVAKADKKVVVVPASAKKTIADSREKRDLSQLSKAGKGAGYVVQVGSFSSKANADALKQKLAGNGYPSFVELTKLKTRDIFRVKVGPNPSRREANLLRLELIDEEKLEGIIVSYP